MNFGLLQCVNVGSFILGKKCIVLVSDIDNARGYAWVRGELIWEISVPSFQFYCKSTTALKKLSL